MYMEKISQSGAEETDFFIFTKFGRTLPTSMFLFLSLEKFELALLAVDLILQFLHLIH